MEDAEGREEGTVEGENEVKDAEAGKGDVWEEIEDVIYTYGREKEKKCKGRRKG